MSSRLKRVLVDPRAVLLGVALGFAIGLAAPDVGRTLFPFGSIFVSFLSMCLIPILISSVIGGIAGLLRDSTTRALFSRMAALWGGGLVLPCLVGVVSAAILQPGVGLGLEAERAVGGLLLQSPLQPPATGGVVAFLSSIIPSNIFAALTQNQVMGIVFASICGGLALGLSNSTASEQALLLTEAIREAFMTLFGWAVVLFGPGLTCLVAGIVSNIEPETLLGLVKFILYFYLGGTALLLVYLIVFIVALKSPFFETFSRLTNVNLVAFMTNNPIIALPVALETLHKSFGFDRRLPELIIPFGLFANQHGAIYLLSFLTVFLAQIYVIDLGLQEYLLISLGSMIAGATAVGGGAILIPSIAPLLGVLGIPTPLALVVLATTDNIIGPVRTVLTLQANVTMTVLVGRRGVETPTEIPEEDLAWEPELT